VRLKNFGLFTDKHRGQLPERSISLLRHFSERAHSSFLQK